MLVAFQRSLELGGFTFDKILVAFHRLESTMYVEGPLVLRFVILHQLPHREAEPLSAHGMLSPDLVPHVTTVEISRFARRIDEHLFVDRRF